MRYCENVVFLRNADLLGQSSSGSSSVNINRWVAVSSRYAGIPKGLTLIRCERVDLIFDWYEPCNKYYKPILVDRWNDKWS